MITLFLDETGTDYAPESSKNGLLTSNQQEGSSNEMLERLGSPCATEVKRMRVFMICPPYLHMAKHWAHKILKEHFI